MRIGRIEVRPDGWRPTITLRELTLFDPQQRPALTLAHVQATLSPRSLLALDLRFDQLLFEGVRLQVRRDAAGRLFVAGLETGGAQAADADGPALRDWVFRQRELVLRGGTLVWTDEQRDAPPLALSDVQIVLRNGLRRHDLRLDATPPATWGERFTATGRFTQRLLAAPGDWSQWSGNAHIDLPRVDVRELRRHVDLPFELSEGDGGLRAWAELGAGRLRGATVDLALRAVTMRLASSAEPLAVEQVQGRLVATHGDEGSSLALQQFGFVTGDGVRWPHGDLSLAWQQRDDGPVTGGHFKAQALDLAVMAQIAERLPLGAALRELLAELQPQGVAQGVEAGWSGALDAPDSYRVKARLEGLTLAAKASGDPAAAGRPGLARAALQVDATERGGSAKLAIDDGALEFPGVFAQPVVPLQSLAAQLAWKVEPVEGRPPKLTLQVREARFANADAQGTLEASWHTGAGDGVAHGGRLPGVLQMSGRIVRGDATQIARYLPLGIPEATRRYVGRAVRAGRVEDVDFRVRGDLWDFPFDAARSAQDGQFRIVGKVRDATFAYVPGEPPTAARPAVPSDWPAFTNVEGELLFDRSAMAIREARARVGGVQLAGVNGTIRNYDEGLLAIEGTARGALADMLRFVDATPVGDWTGRALAQARATGAAELKLALALPLDQPERTRVKGSVQLAGNDLRLTPQTPLLGALRGKVDFTEDGFTVIGANARVLGGELAFDGAMQSDGSIRFAGQGTASAEGLRRAPELGALSRLAVAMTGQAPYRLALNVQHGHPEIALTSSLAGMGLDLPAPLRKPAEATLPLRVNSALLADTPAGQPPRDLLRVELGTLLQAQWQRELRDDGERVLRGGIGINEPAPWPAAGVAAQVTLPALAVDPWEQTLARLLPPGAAGEPGTAAAGSAYAPTRIGARLGELSSGSRRFTQVVAGLTQDDGDWRASIDAEQLAGYVEYRAARGAQAAGRIHARLARLSLPKSDAEEVERTLEMQSPNAVPALDIVVEDFELRGKRLGRVEVEAVNRMVGEGRDAVREWRLNKLLVAMPEAQLSGTGRWAELGGTVMTAPGLPVARRRAVLDFKLDVANGGALLERLGSGQVVRGGKGQLTGQVSWLGSPLALDYGSLAGEVAVAIDAGQFLKADPGAARLLGVLSLQSLPRRLALDFRDVFQQGFAFDNLTGDVKIAQGVAQTNNLRMRGVQAAVLMEGRADLQRETQDLRVIVVPEINAGTASLAYAAINPAIGLGTFLAQALLRKPLAAAGTREFKVTGAWADPQVERVERKPGEAAPDIDAPASAPR